MRSARRLGFTILELVIVILIIALLLSMLIPAAVSVKRKASLSKCANNLRQIGQAIEMYRSDRKTWPYAKPVPTPFHLFAPPWDHPTAQTIPEVLADYLKSDSDVYRCPGDRNGEVFDRCEAARPGTGISYMYWPPQGLPTGVYAVKQNKLLARVMNDFQGWSGAWSADFPGGIKIGMFHPPRYGVNTLRPDGSVEFGHITDPLQ